MTNKQSTLNLSVTDSTTKPHTLRTFLSDRETCCCAGSRIVRDFCLLPQPCYHRPIDLPLLFLFCFGTPEKLCHSFPGRTCGQLGCHSTLIVMSNIHTARRDQCWYLIVPFLKNAEAQSDNQFGTSFFKNSTHKVN